jgi:AcrR family transcriptional regulator
LSSSTAGRVATASGGPGHTAGTKQSVTLDEIAVAARVTKGAVHHHFPSKEASFRAVHAQVQGEAQARAAAAGDSDGSPTDQIVAPVRLPRCRVAAQRDAISGSPKISSRPWLVSTRNPHRCGEAIPRFGQQASLIWGDACDFLPITDAQRLASDFPRASLVVVLEPRRGSRFDNPSAVVGAVVTFVPATVT